MEKRSLKHLEMFRNSAIEKLLFTDFSGKELNLLYWASSLRHLTFTSSISSGIIHFHTWEYEKTVSVLLSPELMVKWRETEGSIYFLKCFPWVMSPRADGWSARLNWKKWNVVTGKGEQLLWMDCRHYLSLSCVSTLSCKWGQRECVCMRLLAWLRG